MTPIHAAVLARNLAGASLLALLPAAALAQTPGPAATAAADEEIVQEIVVTGTSRARIALDTPLAVTQVNETSLIRLGGTGQATILNTIPTIKADGGGGEVAANVFVRGLLSGG